MHGTLYIRGDFPLENNKARLKDGRGRQLNRLLTAKYEKPSGRRSGQSTPRSATPTHAPPSAHASPWNEAEREANLKRQAKEVGEWLVECHKHDEEVEFIWPSGQWGTTECDVWVDRWRRCP